MVKSKEKVNPLNTYETLSKEDKAKMNTATLKLMLKIKAFVNKRNAFLTQRFLMIQERYILLAEE